MRRCNCGAKNQAGVARGAQLKDLPKLPGFFPLITLHASCRNCPEETSVIHKELGRGAPPMADSRWVFSLELGETTQNESLLLFGGPGTKKRPNFRNQKFGLEDGFLQIRIRRGFFEQAILVTGQGVRGNQYYWKRARRSCLKQPAEGHSVDRLAIAFCVGQRDVDENQVYTSGFDFANQRRNVFRNQAGESAGPLERHTEEFRDQRVVFDNQNALSRLAAEL